MISTLALPISNPLDDTTCPSTTPYSTMKWHFSKFKTKLVSIKVTRTKSVGEPVKQVVRWFNWLGRLDHIKPVSPDFINIIKYITCR